MKFFHRLRKIPWFWLFLSAFLSTLIIAAVDGALFNLANGSLENEEPNLASYLESSLLVSPVIGFFAGALLVVLTTRIFPRVSLKGENTFVLIAFALLLLTIKTQLTLPWALLRIGFLDFYTLSFPPFLGGALMAGRRHF